MHEELFRKIGLTEGEIKVYLALVKLGETTIGPLGKESKVTKSKIYDILDKLIAKGLIGHNIKNQTKHFIANNPKLILEYLSKKSEELEQTQQEATLLVDQLSLLRTVQQKSIAEIYEGFHGLRSIREELLATLKKGEELLVLGAPRIANEKWEAWFLQFHTRREERGDGMRIIYNPNTRSYGERRKQFKKTHVKYFPEKLAIPNWIDIYKDTVLFVIVNRDPVVTIVLRDKSLADSFRYSFEIMWKSCVD